MVSAAAKRSGGPLSDEAVHHHWEGYCSAAELAPGIERAGIYHDKPARPAPAYRDHRAAGPSASSRTPPPAPAGHGTGCTWRITRGEWLSVR